MTIFDTILKDIDAVMDRDPAARYRAEVIFVYAGFQALVAYRVANWFWRHDLGLLARMISHFARWMTGIEIHPGATIGTGVFIDHGLGVVIGETVTLADNVTLYQGVTLGGTSWEKGKRHPTLNKGVIVGAGAKILGPIEIGENARIGSNAVVVKNVPANTTVVGVPAKAVLKRKARDNKGFYPYAASNGDLPDPTGKAVDNLAGIVNALSARIEKLESELAEAQAERRAEAKAESDAKRPRKRPRA